MRTVHKNMPFLTMLVRICCVFFYQCPLNTFLVIEKDKIVTFGRFRSLFLKITSSGYMYFDILIPIFILNDLLFT